MSRPKVGSHTISGAFVFLLLGVFALSAVVMVLLGAGAYNRTVDAAAAHNELRIGPSYLRTMVRGHDETGGIRTERLTGILRQEEETGDVHTEPVDLDAIVLEDVEAVTRLFVYEGMLYECSEPLDEEEWTGEEDVFSDDGDAFFDDAEVSFAEDDTQTAPEEGICDGARMQPVCAAEAMQAERTGNLLTIRLQEGGAWHTLSCALHAEEP